VILNATDARFSQPQLTNISNLRFRFYGVQEEDIYVCNTIPLHACTEVILVCTCVQVGLNGLLSFRAPSDSIFPSRVPPPLSANSPLLTNYTLIAPFWDRIYFGNRQTGQVGRILYRYSDNQTLLDRIGTYISTAFDSSFSPRLLFITTWDRTTLDYYYSSAVSEPQN
jgi:hypothetical protein